MFLHAWSKSKTEVIYRDDNGSEVIRSGGSRSWRNCNPGNIIKGTFADLCGSIGSEIKFAIFPDEETGLSAVRSLFRSRSYRDLSLKQAIYRYAPPDDGNNSEVYVLAVAKSLGVPPTMIIKDLSDQQLVALSSAVKTHEGWKPGTVIDQPSKTSSSAAAEAPNTALASKVNLVVDDQNDAATVRKLVAIGLDAERCAEVRAKAFKAMIPIYGTPTSIDPAH